MSTHYVYLDQNVVSLQAEGRINFAGIDRVQWIYSKEHFAEIRRSSAPQLYLNALDQLGASLLEIDLHNWKPSGSATVTSGVSARENYARYLDAINAVPFDTNALSSLLAWSNGGRCSDAARYAPDALEEQINRLISNLPVGLIPTNIQETSAEFRRTIAEMLAHENNIALTRKALGVGKGVAGSVTGSNPIQQIWKMISPNAQGLTCDQLFGFEPIAALKQQQWTPYEGIIRCCAMLDIIGYQSEQKSRDPKKIPNVMSDAVHIAAAAYCAAVISADKRFSQRAKAIYEYKNISTVALFIDVAGRQRSAGP